MEKYVFDLEQHEMLKVLCEKIKPKKRKFEDIDIETKNLDKMTDTELDLYEAYIDQVIKNEKNTTRECQKIIDTIHKLNLQIDKLYEQNRIKK